MMNERRHGSDKAAVQRSGTQDAPREIVPNAN